MYVINSHISQIFQYFLNIYSLTPSLIVQNTQNLGLNSIYVCLNNKKYMNFSYITNILDFQVPLGLSEDKQEGIRSIE